MKLVPLLIVYTMLAIYIQPSSSDNSQDQPTTSSMVIKLPGRRPEHVDSYVCTSRKVEHYTGSIVGFEPNHDARENAHHILIIGCTGMDTQLTYGKCMMNTHCTGRSIIMYAWAKNAPGTTLPKDVGFKIGRGTNINYLVLQVHYGPQIKEKLNSPNFIDTSGVTVRLSTASQKYSAGMYDFLSEEFVIPPHSIAKDDIACRYDESYELHPFAFRVHAHQLGQQISGYIVRDGKWILVGQADPRKPNAFFPIHNNVTIKKNDLLFVRCVFRSDRDTATYMGSRHNDEMCNFYIMYYTNHHESSPYHGCEKAAAASLSRQVPKVTSAQSIKESGDNLGSHDSQHPHPDKGYQQENTDFRTEIKNDQLDRQTGNAENTENIRQTTSNSELSALKLVPNWPAQFFLTGDIGGVAVSSGGNVFIFHRGDHHWEKRSFDHNHKFQNPESPIKTNTIIELDPDTGDIVRRFGKNMFYLPHGIAIDHENNIWVTDVALHQVFKFKPNSRRPSIVLGVKFQPGNDSKHFCQPSGITISKKTGIVYVADGYCNSRVVRFHSDGRYIDEFSPIAYRSMRNKRQVIHSVTLDDKNDKLYIVDKRNHIIFDIDIRRSRFLPFGENNHLKVVAAQFNPANGGILYTITKDGVGNDQISRGYTLDAVTGNILQSWQPNREYFDDPHDIAVAPDASAVYVAELKGGRILKFMPDNYNQDSTDKSTIQGIAKNCVQTCHQVYSPVCGSDGRTYNSECFLRYSSCIHNVTVTKVEEGPCPSPTTRKATVKPKPNPTPSKSKPKPTLSKPKPKPTLSKPKPTKECTGDCPRIYDPVCGSNGKTFNNDCLMEFAACKTGQVIKAVHYGPCKHPVSPPKPTEKLCNDDCPRIYDPVCGNNGHTFDNDCLMKFTICKTGQAIKVAHYGPCKHGTQQPQPTATKRICNAMCDYDPENPKRVCGSDGKTYNNECVLKYEACKNAKAITVHSQGRCKTKPNSNVTIVSTISTVKNDTSTSHPVKTDHIAISTTKPNGLFNLSFASIALMILVLVVVVPLAIFVVITVICRYRSNKRRSRYLNRVTGYKGRNANYGFCCCKKGSYGFFLDENHESYKRNLYFPDDDDDDDDDEI